MTKKYKNNLNQIKNSYPGLLEKLNQAKQPSWLIRIKNNKINNFLVNNIPMYKPENPLKEPKEYVKNSRFKRNECSVILGIGHGYLLKEIIKKAHKEHVIIVVDPIPYLIKTALEFWDFSDWIRRKKLIIVTNEKEVNEVLSAVDTQLVITQYQLICDEYTLNREEYININLYAKNLLDQIMCQTGTIGGAGERMVLNDVESIPFIMNKPGVIKLVNIYENKPAVVVCTGPSLEKNIHNLIEYKDKVIIIAVAQALRMLLAYDIKPDFICTVDYGKTNYSHFEGLMDCGIPLVALNKTYAQILQDYQSPIYITTSPINPDDKSLTSVMKDKGAMQGGGSVAHFAFNLAIAMGCSHITLIGQDLALTDKSHNKQADSMGKIEICEQTGLIQWTVEDPLSNLYGNSYTMGFAQFVLGYFNKNVLSNTGLASFITSYEGIINILPEQIKIFNSTEGGAHIKGAKRLRLKQFLEKYCQISITKLTTKEILKTTESVDNKNKCLELIEQDIEILEKIIKSSKRAISTCKILRNFKSRKDKQHLLDYYLQKNFNIIRKEASPEVKKIPLIQLLIHQAIKDSHNHEKLTDKKTTSKMNKKQFLINVNRSESMMTSTKEAAKTLLTAYLKIEKIITQKTNNKIKQSPKKKISDLEKYLNIGNFSYPITYINNIYKQEKHLTQIENAALINIYDKATKLRNETIKEAIQIQDKLENTEEWNLPIVLDLLDESRKIAKEKTHGDTKDKLLEAQKLMPNNEEVIWGLATVHWFFKEWEDGIDLYNILIKKSPENLQYQYERSNIKICTGGKFLQEGINELISVMEKTDLYDKAFKSLGNLYLSLGKTELAKGAYIQYLKKWPHDPDIKKKLKNIS